MTQRAFVQHGMLPVYHSACERTMLFALLVAECGKHEGKLKRRRLESRVVGWRELKG